MISGLDLSFGETSFKTLEAPEAWVSVRPAQFSGSGWGSTDCFWRAHCYDTLWSKINNDCTTSNNRSNIRIRPMSAQPPRGPSFINPASGFGAYAGGGTIAFGTSSTSITTNARAAGAGGSALSAFSGFQPSAFAAGKRPTYGPVFDQTITLAAPTTNAFGAQTQPKRGGVSVFAHPRCTTVTPLAFV
ncbi:hypothetical protein BKA70DRAFT_1396022 [Coprinopsis sp. MPI-PUGE-AT-0042]|nr:hypothetical protein BKA70DRAFT_1396022 [Coprinopsis sp. MPI-PUGE-AT-0042]